ncbi:asparagine synthase [Acanthamoeba polyphaga moumouvirus]|uniref:asparagine synthase (glutamine-hydrolyzing) n=2 Tax=Moumouvirus TaxID=3080801 RepID=L7RC73_9VIRU|nr:asparagine synthase [Acanthamoeba polyphaga moumouvirus]AEX62897.1 glutamine-dependent asparagine synthetase [Moumouvirus Monve]AGC01872.1 asparagine synthase [Acanthamoeba polyphaga moumouvirus]AQN68232.1 asparagine synthase [Saudi moumouvirus]
MCGIFCLLKYDGEEIDLEKAIKCLEKLSARGPDSLSYKYIQVNEKIRLFLGFTRLAIMDTSSAGVQPFQNEDDYIICNGEIYNFKDLAEKYNISMSSQCDCEILLPLFKKVGFVDMISKNLDAEFATVLFDSKNKKLYAARDRYGVRPLYYGYNKKDNTIAFGSELKSLHSIMEHVEQLKPNLYAEINLEQIRDLNNFHDYLHQYYDFNKLTASEYNNNVENIKMKIRDIFTRAVKKRLESDRPIGFLLSGGLDSSLIVSIATKILGPEKIVCFSIGLPGSPDVEAAKCVVKYLGIKEHHIVPFTIEQGIEQIPTVIYTIETYDITTIRASTPQYIMAKYIHDNTNIRVLLSGEGSDEIHGSYKYMRFAPNSEEFHWETIRLLEELCYFDNKRTDRSMADNGLEVRVPFLDYEYVEFITSIDPNLLMYRKDYLEKKIIRDAFIGYLPDKVLYRPKEAFSDAVSSQNVNWYKNIQEIANNSITNAELEINPYIHNKPEIKEALYYRRIFDNIYPGRDNVLPHYWLPRFQTKKISDPSATVLAD